MGCGSNESTKITNIDINESIVKKSNDSFIPGSLIEKLSETIIRIEYRNKFCTGFFMKINFHEKNHNFLLTCAHSISKEDINSKITISIFYGRKKTEIEKKIKLDNNKRFIKCFIDDDIDTTIIEILPEDEIPENKYLYPDLNYLNGFEQYINKDIYTAGYPNVDLYKGEKHFSGGKILGFKYVNGNNNDFIHICSTKDGSSGSPLINENLKVVGIHYGCHKKKAINYGVFIGAIIENLYKVNQKKMIKFKAQILNINKNEEKNDNKENIKIKTFKNEIYSDKKSQNKNDKIIEMNNIKAKKIKITKNNDNINLNNDKNINKNETEKIIIEGKVPKNEENNDLIIKILSKVEDNNKYLKQILDLCVSLIIEIFNIYLFINLMKILFQDKKVINYLNNMIYLQKIKDSNQIVKQTDLKNNDKGNENINNPKTYDNII